MEITITIPDEGVAALVDAIIARINGKASPKKAAAKKAAAKKASPEKAEEKAEEVEDASGVSRDQVRDKIRDLIAGSDNVGETKVRIVRILQEFGSASSVTNIDAGSLSVVLEKLEEI